MKLFSRLSKANVLADTVAENAISTNAKYPCNAAPLDDLSYHVRITANGLDPVAPELLHSICFIPHEQIPWSQLRHLNILGDHEVSCNKQLSAAYISPGAYISRNGDWLLIVHPNIRKVQEYLNRCSDQLQKLGIYNISIPTITLPPNSNLKRLDILRNSKLSCLQGLEKLDQLEMLDISFCDKLTEVPGLGCLTNITSLTFFCCKGLKSVGGLEHLTKLTNLRLYECPSITRLDELENLTALTNLELSWCWNLSALPEMDQLTELVELKLLKCPSIAKLPSGIRHMKKLRKLELRYLQLDSLPDWLPEIAEAFFMDNEYHSSGNKRAVVEFYGTTVAGMDMSLFDMPYEMVVRWFESHAAAKARAAIEEAACGESIFEEADCTEPEQEKVREEVSSLNEIKVVFLGDGEAGKSLTIARLLNDGNGPENFDGQATPGIAITHRIYNLENRQVQVHFWDFGGQEILHSMHRMFLTKQTLYVVLLNARDDKQDEQARYWLHNIKSFTSDPNDANNKGAKVLLVVNKIDQNPNASLNETGLRQLYPSMAEVVRMSALKSSREEFTDTFTSALLRQIGDFEVLKSPFIPEWQQLKETLRHMPQHYIKSDEFTRFCQECGVEENETVRKTLLEQFKNLGISFCYSESQKLEDYVVLQPHWITNAIYILLYNKIPGNKNGMIPHADIYRMLKEPDALSDTVHRVLKDVYYSSDEVQYVLNVIRHFRLSYPVDSDTEFFPMLCDRNETTIVSAYAGKPDVLEFKIVYEYLPNNVLHRLMVDMHRELQPDHVWLTGAHFLQNHSQLSAVVKSDGNIMTIYVRRGKEYPAKVYLDTIKDHLERISKDMGLEIRERQIVYYEAGLSDSFDYDELIGSLASNIPSLYSKKMKKAIPIKDILQQSGHQASKDREKLIQDILLNCRRMQTNRIYWKASEDDRNTYIRDALENIGYIAKDQTLVGVGAGGKRAGELDIEIRKVPAAPWTIFEGLNLRGTCSSEVENWNKHLKKLLDNYNPSGLPFLIMTSYIPCKKDSFPDICGTFMTQAMSYSPDTYFLRKQEEINTSSDYMEETNYLRMVKCLYDCGGAMTTVYHIFVRLGDE